MAKVSKRARKFIGRTIRRLAHRGERAPRRVAIAHAKARRRGFRVPKRRRNPAGLVAPVLWSEREAWRAVERYAKSIVGADAKEQRVADSIRAIAVHMLAQLARGEHHNPATVRSEREAWKYIAARLTKILQHSTGSVYNEAMSAAGVVTAMVKQLDRGIHANPLLGVVGNPPKGARRLASQVYELRYRHAQGRQENFRHPFRAGAEAFCLPGGAILIKHRRGLPLWKDFPDAR